MFGNKVTAQQHWSEAYVGFFFAGLCIDGVHLKICTLCNMSVYIWGNKCRNKLSCMPFMSSNLYSQQWLIGIEGSIHIYTYFLFKITLYHSWMQKLLWRLNEASKEHLRSLLVSLCYRVLLFSYTNKNMNVTTQFYSPQKWSNSTDLPLLIN